MLPVVFFIWIQGASWSNLTHCGNLQCRLPSFKCMLAGQEGGCIIYDENKPAANDRQKKNRQETDPHTRLKQSKTVTLVTPHDTFFMLNVKHCHPPCWEPHWGQKQEASELGILRDGACIVPICWSRRFTDELLEKKEIRGKLIPAAALNQGYRLF